ncbi:MAG: hypothetical protein WCN27_01280 [Alphaproteobacteria bacterium]
MNTHKTTDQELKARLEKALRENLRKRKDQQRERKSTEKKEESSNTTIESKTS